MLMREVEEEMEQRSITEERNSPYSQTTLENTIISKLKFYTKIRIEILLTKKLTNESLLSIL